MSERKINLGKLEGVPEVRIHHWHTEHRHTWHVAYAIVNADISDDAWNSVQNWALSDRKMNQAETQGIGTSLNLR
jgi:hypothetical protein